MAIKHAFVSAKADGADATLVRPSDWNANHTIDPGTIAHADLTGLGNDEHTQYLKEKLSGGLAGEVPTHSHSGAPQAGTVSHLDLTNWDANTHHAQAHAIGGADHTGSLNHSALAGLGNDEHTQYALLAGRASGQTLKGGTAASENLTLESTAHATKGRVDVLDPLKLSGVMSVQGATPDANKWINLAATKTVSADGSLINLAATLTIDTAGVDIRAVQASNMQVSVNSGIAAGILTALDFTMVALGGGGGASTGTMTGIVANNNIVNFTGTINESLGIKVQRSVIGGSPTITTYRGLHIGALGHSSTTNTYGIYMESPSGGTNRYGIWVADVAAGTIARILELGPATPHLRLEGTGNWAPAANTKTSPLWVIFGNNDNPLTKTLRNIVWEDFANLVAGDKVLKAV